MELLINYSRDSSLALRNKYVESSYLDWFLKLPIMLAISVQNSMKIYHKLAI